MKELKIDHEFQSLLPYLSNEDFSQLEEVLKKEGCRDALVVWQGVIVDGHNRYRICRENDIPFKTEEKEFSDRDEVIEWMLKNQLVRRNLNDHQRNEVALRFQKVIAERMRKKQSEAGGDKKSSAVKIASDQTNRSDTKPSTTRKEMAKIAGTSEVSVYRTKQILEKGTPEQIERARKGGAGNSIFAIHKEISGKNKPEKVKPKETEPIIKLEPIPKEEPEKFKICSKCNQKMPLKAFEASTLNGYPDDVCGNCIDIQIKAAGGKMKVKPMTKEDKAILVSVIASNKNIGQEIVYTIENLIEEINANFRIYLQSLDSDIQRNILMIGEEENNKKIMATLSESVIAIEKLKGKYSL